MEEYRKILVPVDGSFLSDLAFKQALILAKLIDGDITAIHVTKDPDPHCVGLEGTDMIIKTRSIKRETRKMGMAIRSCHPVHIRPIPGALPTQRPG